MDWFSDGDESMILNSCDDPEIRPHFYGQLLISIGYESESRCDRDKLGNCADLEFLASE